MEGVTHLLQQIGNHVGVWLYVIAGAFAFGEASIMIGVVLPGETALLVAGYYTHEGVLSLPVMIVIAVACAIAGDSVGYEFGRWFGPRLKKTRLGTFVGESRWEKAEEFLARHGGKAVLLGRAVAVLRALVPTMAGMSKMRYRTFLPWNAAGGMIWGTACVLLGYYFAFALDKVERYLTWGPIVVIVALIVVFGGRELIRHRRRRAASHADEAPGSGTDRESEPAAPTAGKQ